MRVLLPLTILIYSTILGLTLHLAVHITEAATTLAAPPSPYQRNPDIYEISGYPSPKLQTLNPLTQKLQAGGRTITYSFTVVPGCSAGNMQSTLQDALALASSKVHITFVPVSTAADVTVRATCGVDAANVGLSGGAIADLYPSWPYQSQVNALTTMATFYDLSQRTIWYHEIMGHALGTWNEQYQLDGNFSATPNLVDYMNTGDLSRTEDWPQNDTDRWERTMYPIQTPIDCSGPTDPFGNTWNSCTLRWVNPSGWSYDPSTGIWYDPAGTEAYGACNGDHLRWAQSDQRWKIPGHDDGFSPQFNQWVVVPAC